MTNYGPWKIWNGGECPVDAGTRGQLQLYGESRSKAEDGFIYNIAEYEWGKGANMQPIIAYREVIEPEVIVWDGLWDSGRKAIIGRGMCSAGLSRGVRITIQGDSIKAEWVE